MTMTASIAVITADASVPAKVEAELRLLTLSGSDNPLAEGGKLVRTIPGTTSAPYDIRSGTTTFTDRSALSTTLPSPVAFELRTPAGSRLFELGLEVVDYTSGSLEDRVEIKVEFTGMSAAVAHSLSLDTTTYTWRLSGVAAMVDGVLKLAFELVQEEVATEFVDPQASVRLVFTDGGGEQLASMKVKRSGVLVQPT